MDNTDTKKEEIPNWKTPETRAVALFIIGAIDDPETKSATEVIQKAVFEYGEEQRRNAVVDGIRHSSGVLRLLGYDVERTYEEMKLEKEDAAKNEA